MDSAYCGDDGPCAAFWISTDVGSSIVPWPAATSDGLGSGSVMATSKQHIGHVFVGNGQHTIFRNKESGNNWKPLAALVPAGPKSISGIALNAKDDIYVATVTSAGGAPCSDCEYHGGQFYLSKNDGESWTQGADWIDGGNGSGWLAIVTAFYPPN